MRYGRRASTGILLAMSGSVSLLVRFFPSDEDGIIVAAAAVALLLLLFMLEEEVSLLGTSRSDGVHSNRGLCTARCCAAAAAAKLSVLLSFIMIPASLPRNGIIFGADSFFWLMRCLSGDCAAAKHKTKK